MAYGHTAAFCLRTECHRLELTDELLKSLIKDKFFHITPIHPYPAYYSFHSRALSRHVTSQDQNIRGLGVKACSPRTEPPIPIPRSDRWICFMHSRVFPHTLRNPRLFQQQSHSGIKLPKQTQTMPGAYQHEEAFKRIVARAGLWYAENFSISIRRICFQVQAYFVEKVLFQLVPNFSSKSAVKHSAQPDDIPDLAIRDRSDP